MTMGDDMIATVVSALSHSAISVLANQASASPDSRITRWFVLDLVNEGRSIGPIPSKDHSPSKRNSISANEGLGVRFDRDSRFRRRGMKSKRPMKRAPAKKAG